VGLSRRWHSQSGRVEVYRKGGKAILLLIHLEVQAAPEKDFAERMFTYAIRIFEYFHEFPVSLAILCDVVVMAHLKTQETKNDSGNRKTWKFILVKRLYELGYRRSDVLNLFKFIDWAMILPEGLKRAFWEELKIYEEEHEMPYVTSIEKIGMEKATKTIALNMLRKNMDLTTIAELTGLPIVQLQKLQAENK
jgi:hypothetical protein